VNVVRLHKTITQEKFHKNITIFSRLQEKDGAELPEGRAI
jgi:hypothetical protein